MYWVTGCIRRIQGSRCFRKNSLEKDVKVGQRRAVKLLKVDHQSEWITGDNQFLEATFINNDIMESLARVNLKWST